MADEEGAAAAPVEAPESSRVQDDQAAEAKDQKSDKAHESKDGEEEETHKDRGRDRRDRDRDHRDRRDRRDRDRRDRDRDDRDRREHRDRRDRDRDDRDRRDRDRDDRDRRDKDRDRRHRDRDYDRRDRYDRYDDRRHRRSRSRDRNRRRHSRSRSKSHSRSPEVELTAEEREQQRQQEQIEDLTKDQRTVFVSQLVMKADERKVRKYFEKVGKVKKVIMIRDKYTNRHKGFAYVEMKDLESIPMVLMLNGTVPDFQRFPILVKASEAEKNFLAKQEAAAAEGATPLYVGNLHEQIGEEDLKTVLQAFGHIESVQLQRDEAGTSKGFGMVTFARAEDANTAIKKIGSDGLELMGMQIKVAPLPQNKNGGGTAEASGAAPGPSGTNATANWKLDDDEGTGLQMSAQSRAALMARLGQNAGVNVPTGGAMPNAAAAQALAVQAQLAGMGPGLLQPPGLPVAGLLNPGMPPPVLPAMPAVPIAALGPPTMALLIKNMFDPTTETEEGWHLDIKEDTETECAKFGQVLHCYVDPKDPAGLSYVLFSSPDGSLKAAQHLNGRWFAGRSIAVEYMQPADYASRVPGGADAVAAASNSGTSNGQ